MGCGGWRRLRPPAESGRREPCQIARTAYARALIAASGLCLPSRVRAWSLPIRGARRIAGLCRCSGWCRLRWRRDRGSDLLPLRSADHGAGAADPARLDVRSAPERLHPSERGRVQRRVASREGRRPLAPVPPLRRLGRDGNRPRDRFTRTKIRHRSGAIPTQLRPIRTRLGGIHTGCERCVCIYLRSVLARGNCHGRLGKVAPALRAWTGVRRYGIRSRSGRPSA